MFGAFLFFNVFLNLGDNCRNKVLGNIFGVDNVSVSDFVIREDKVIFRFFSQNVFYQYIFDFTINESEAVMDVSCSRAIVNTIISVKKVSDLDSFSFDYLLVDIFKSQDEYQIYQLMRKFL